MNSKGSLALNNDHRSGAEWATLLSTSEANVSRWRSGKFKPGKAARTLIHSLGGPEPAAWDEDAPSAPQRQAAKPAPKPPPKKRRRKPGGATARTVCEEADLWLSELQDFRAELPNLVNDPRSRANMIGNAAKTLAVLGKLTGVGLSISPRQILDSPNWRLIEAQIIGALKPFGPEPLRAVAKALDATRGG